MNKYLNLKKYFEIFKISLAQELVYKLSFFMMRLRNIIQILVFFFLWTSVFPDNTVTYFGYNRQTIIAYTFLLIFIRSFVLSSRSQDASGHISSGELSNYLLKPFSYFKYLIARDFAGKFLNMAFSLVEIAVLFLILKPDIFVQTDPVFILLFIISLIIAAFIYFNIVMLASSVPFWVPELGWGTQFLVIMIFVEFLSGAFFPLDVFPEVVYNILKMSPFPYMVFVPIKVYLGGGEIMEIIKNILIGSLWGATLWIIMNKVWKKGLKVYESVGR